MTTKGIASLAVHLAVGGTVVWSLQRHLDRREGELDVLDRLAVQERRITLEQERDLAIQHRLLEALRRQDPYVIEMIARSRHDFAGPNEVAPPMTEDHAPIPGLNGDLPGP